MDSSALTFDGTVVDFDNSNVGNIQPGAVPMIVRVKKIDWIDPAAQKTFRSLPGKDVTVVFDPLKVTNANAMQAGVDGVFFVNPLVYEKHIAVAAENVVQSSTVTQLSGKLSTAAQEKADAALAASIKSADKIVVGRVMDVRQLSREKLEALRRVGNGRQLFSEHRPGWKEAVIEVKTFLKGTSEERFVIVIFPGTSDRMWAIAPKFVVGQSGTWMLHTDQLSAEDANILLAAEPLHGQRVNSYTALEAVDFQIRDADGKNLQRIRRLLNVHSP